jgi:hypothetical protein
MASKSIKTLIGEMECGCGMTIPVRQSENGTLHFSCQWCEAPGYAKAGTQHHANTLKKVRSKVPEKVPMGTPIKEPEATEKPPAAKPAKATIWG